MALTQQDKEEIYQYIVSRGQSIAGLPEGEATLTNKYLGPVIEYGSGGASGRLVRLAVSLLQGKPAVLRNEGGLIQWAIQGTQIWETLVNVSQLKGENGKNPVFRKNGANLEYKIDGTPDTTYQTLVALSEITGPEGDHIVLEVRDGAIMYKQSKAPDSDFQTVFFLADVKGDKGDTGPAPVLEFGTVTTVEPSEPAVAVWVENGVDASGAKKYQLNLSIPKGRDGADGLGSGNVSVPPAALKAGVTYLFKPSADGSAEGEFIEYTAPTQVQSDWNVTDTGLPSFIQNKPALKPVATSGSYNDLTDKPSEIQTATIAKGLSNENFVSDLNNPTPVNGLAWCNYTSLNTPPYKDGNLFQICCVDPPTFGDTWSWVNQLFFGTNGQIYHRNFTNTSKWGTWAKLAFSYEIPDLGNLTSNIVFSNIVGSTRGITGTVGGNDCWRVVGGSGGENEGYLEIATGDDGAEPIYVTQYMGNFAEVKRSATLLDAAGNTNFPGTVTSGGQALVRTDDARLSNARPANGGTSDYTKMINGFYTGNGGQQPPSYIPSGKVRLNMMNNVINGDGSYKDWLLMDTYGGGDVPVVTAFGISKSTALRAFIMQGAKGGASWERTAELFHSGNLFTATQSVAGLMSTADKIKMDSLRSYATASTVTNVNVSYEVVFVTLGANASLSLSAAGAAYNGRTITLFVYCPAARTIAIPTTGSYISMCGSSYTCPAGKWVEFNLVCVNGIWHIAKLEQE